MFIKSLSLYGGFRLFTMLAGFLQIFFISRRFGVTGYGEISLILAYATYVNIFIFQWMSKVTSRYSNDKDKNFSILSLHLVLGLIFLLIIVPFSYFIGSMLIICVIALVESYKEHLLEYFRATLQIQQYGFFSFLNSLVIVLSLIVAFNSDITVQEYLVILYVIYMVLIFFYIFKYKLLGSIKDLLHQDIVEHFKFGYSISMSNSVAQFAFSGVRIIIGQRFGNEVLGIFSIIYDSIQRSIVSYMQILNSTVFPLMRNGWDDKNYKLLNAYLRLNFSLLVYIPLFTVFFILCFLDLFMRLVKVNQASVNFNIGLMVVLIGIGVIFNRIKTFHTDYFFMFVYRTDIILKNTLISMGLLGVLLLILHNNSNIIYINACVSLVYLVSLTLNGFYLKKVISETYPLKVFKLYEGFFVVYFIAALYALTLDIGQLIAIKIFLGTTLVFMLAFNVIKNYRNLRGVELA